MKISYKFTTGEVTEVEVSDEIGAVIVESRRKEENLARKERYHCYSYDASEYEGKEYADRNTPETVYETKILEKQLSEGLGFLTETQKRRLLQFANGLSYREIARLEKTTHSKISKSVEQARKKLKNFLGQGGPKPDSNLLTMKGIQPRSFGKEQKDEA